MTSVYDIDRLQTAYERVEEVLDQEFGHPDQVFDDALVEHAAARGSTCARSMIMEFARISAPGVNMRDRIMVLIDDMIVANAIAIAQARPKVS